MRRWRAPLRCYISGAFCSPPFASKVKQKMVKEEESRTGLNTAVAERVKADTAKIEIIVTWKGETIKRTREEEWWGKLSIEEIINEIELVIDGIDEQ